VDVDEGPFQVSVERSWNVRVMGHEEARAAAQDEHQTAKARERAETAGAKTEAAQKAIVQAMTKLGPDVKNNIMVASGVHQRDFAGPFAQLIQDGVVVLCDVTRANRKKPYDGYKLAE
jgi:hypothetical protein